MSQNGSLSLDDIILIGKKLDDSTKDTLISMQEQLMNENATSVNMNPNNITDLFDEYKKLFEILQVKNIAYENRDNEWKSLYKMFDEYKQKMGEEINSLKVMILGLKEANEYLEENLMLNNQKVRELENTMILNQDILLRLNSNHKRKMFLEKFEKEVEEEELIISELLSSLKIDN